MSLSVIIPFHRQLDQLKRSVQAVRETAPDAEIIIVADGANVDVRPLAAECHATLVVIAGPSGPAVARNRGTAAASGDVLAFVDADVVVAPGALARLVDVLDREPGVVAVFGAYDHWPAERNFWSQYKNLSHAYVHEIGNPEAATFWAGLGAVRTGAFAAVGGFDERFVRPSVEDIELGYRLRRAGGRLRLDAGIRGTHLKRWTLWGAIRTDVVARGIPWTQLIRKFGTMRSDLNLRWELRASVLLAYLSIAMLPFAFARPWALGVAAAALLLIGFMNAAYYRWFARMRGAGFAARVFPAHLIHHLCNGVSFAAGTAMSFAGRAGWRAAIVVPVSIWDTTRQP